MGKPMSNRYPVKLDEIGTFMPVLTLRKWKELGRNRKDEQTPQCTKHVMGSVNKKIARLRYLG